MHEQEVRRVLFLADLGRYTSCHRNSRNACGTDERVDLAAGEDIHEVTDEEAADCCECESNETDDDDHDGLELQEVLTDSCSTD